MNGGSPTAFDRKIVSSRFRPLSQSATLNTSGRSSAAILYFVPTIGEVAALYGEDGAARLRQQLADWLSGLVRVEDIVARTGSDEFLMLLPETSRDDAEGVRRRVTGVLHQSEFRLTDNVPVGIEVFIQSALRQTDHKYLLHGDRLFDLSADPKEKRDVSAEQAQRAARMRKRVTARMREVRAARERFRQETGARERRLELTDDEARELRALGYLD